MADLSLLQQDALTAARLTDALQPAHSVAVCTSWAALEQRLGREQTDLCVVDADQPSRKEALHRLATLQRLHPGIAVVAFGNFEGQEHAVYRLGRLGIDGVVTAQRGTESGHVRDAVERALLVSRARRAAGLLEGRVSPLGLRAVSWCVENARARPSVDDLAEAMGRSTAAFASLLRDDGLPPPSRLLLWGRLLLAGSLLARDGRTVEETAYRVGYAGASALARAMKREVGRTPGEIAEGRGMEEVHESLFPPGRRGGRGPLRLLLALLVFLQASCAAGPSAAAPPTSDDPGSRVARLLDTPPLDGLHMGILAVEASSGRVVLARNAHRRFIPASNQKILTTAAALHLLGPDFRWETTLWSDAPLSGGVLRGDLVLVGTGDPTLSERWWPSDRAPLEALADSLRAAGVDRIEGALVVDVSAWERDGVPGSWEVGDLPHPWGAAGGGFGVAEGVVTARVRGGAGAGEPATLEEWWPPAEGFLASDLRTTAPDSSTRIRADLRPDSGGLLLTGRVPADRVDTVRLAAREPVRLAAGLLRSALEEAGVSVEEPTRIRWTTAEGMPDGDGEATTSDGGQRRTGAASDDGARRGCVPLPDCPGARRLASLASPPLSEVTRGILEPSQNWMAEQLLRTLGQARSGTGTRQAGLDAVEAYLLEVAGVDSLDVRLEDGSGLAPRNLVTPRALVAVLDQVRRSGHAEAYRAALASPGEEESTLEERLPGLAGRLFAKTGTISNVDALSGYLSRDDGAELIFSLLSNGSGLPAATVRQALDRVVRILAEG